MTNKFKHRLRVVIVLLLVILNIYSISEAITGITGSGAIVINSKTNQVYYAKNADIPRPIASMTKLMSIYLILEEIENNTIQLDSKITVSNKAVEISNNPLYSGFEQLELNQSYKVEDLIKLVLISSCNGSMIALAEHIAGTEEHFVKLMNKQAEAWNLEANFSDCCGIESTNTATPRAMAEIAQHLINEYPEVLEYTSLINTKFKGQVFDNTNTLLGKYEGLDGLKSGTTDAAGYCFTATAQQGDTRIISVVLNSISQAAKSYDIQYLLNYGFKEDANK